jgi:hypothetical protein
MGPFPVEDSLGVQAALAVLHWSQDKTGKYETCVQSNTHRQAQSTFSNITWPGVEGLGDQVGAHERKEVWISKSGTHQFWCLRFMTGLKQRTGQVAKQDRAVTIGVLLEMEKVLEERWRTVTYHEERVEILRLALWCVGGYCTAWHGEEMLIVEAGTASSLVKLDRALV